MKIRKVCDSRKTILVEIPLTTPTGKVRIKQRTSYTDFGIPVSTKNEPFSKNMYVEWQISYYSYEAERSSLKSENLFFTSQSSSGRSQRRFLYELSEYLYYFCNMGVISKEELEALECFIEGIPNCNLIENSYEIYKSYPKPKKLNGMQFLESVIKYPHLIYDFNNGFFVIAEITIREKQRAVGIQPMLYLCFPVECLKDEEGKSLIGRTAKTNECAFLELNEKNAFIVIDCLKIFGMLTENHKNDILQILRLIALNL